MLVKKYKTWDHWVGSIASKSGFPHVGRIGRVCVWLCVCEFVSVSVNAGIVWMGGGSSYFVLFHLSATVNSINEISASGSPSQAN